MRELSKPDILSPMPGQVTGRWSSRLSPILSDDLHFAARPRVSLNVTVDGGGRGKEKKKGKSYRIPKTRGRILFGSETRRKGEKIGRGERVFVFILCIHIYIGGEIIERGKSLEIEARCLFFFFCSSSITRGCYRGGSKNLSKKKWTFVGQRRWLISRIGAIIRHMRVFLSFAYLPDATNRETMQSRETHDHTRNAKLG